jgi:mRNA interferase RelE/StbE
MASYRVVVGRSAERELRQIPERDLRRIVAKMDALAKDPTPPGSIKLEGVRRYRLRQGDWRIVYAIDHASGTVDIVKVGHRREVYR